MAGPKDITIHFDGGSRGNPGPAAAGFVLSDESGARLDAKGLFLGEATNNTAEYTGLVKALDAALGRGASTVTIRSDSELVVRQITGQYKVKSDRLRPLYIRAMDLLARFESWSLTHVPRGENAAADKLVNQALDAGRDVQGQLVPVADVKPVRLGALISGGGTTVLNMVDCIKQGTLPARIPLVISSRSSVAGVERARNVGLDVSILRKKDFPDIDTFSEAIEDALVQANVDLIVQAGWLCLWKIPKCFENRVMNIHPALLPSFGGQGMWGHHVHEAVLAAGCKVSGCTVHFCTDEYDAGPIIVQRTCPVAEDDTPDTLAARVFEQECIAYPEAIRLFAQGRLSVQGRVVRILPM